jgi:DNA-binding HxlR family transcriptional regulator
MADSPRSGCPINAAVESFGDRWTLLVLRDIMFGNRRHFRELQAGSQEAIASNILADRLKRLVHSGLLTRDDASRGQRATYSLTEQAIQLVPVFAELGAWGTRHRPVSHPLRVRAELLEQGGPQLWRTYMDELRETHLGIPSPDRQEPSATAQLAQAYADACAAEVTAALPVQEARTATS